MNFRLFPFLYHKHHHHLLRNIHMHTNMKRRREENAPTLAANYHVIHDQNLIDHGPDSHPSRIIQMNSWWARSPSTSDRASFADDATSSPVIHRREKNTLDELSMRILRREEILHSGEESRAEALGFRLDFAFTLTSHDIIIVAVFFPHTHSQWNTTWVEAQGEN